MKDRNKEINLMALGEVFVDSIKDDIEKVSEILVRLKYKDKTVLDTVIKTNPTDLGNTLVEVFGKSLADVSDVEVSYIAEGVEKRINGISIV